MENLKEQLKKHSKAKLIEIIEKIYFQCNENIQSQIELQVLSSEKDALINQMEEKLNQWQYMNHFIHYSETYYFSQEIASFTDILENQLLHKNPVKVLELSEELMKVSENIINNCDDSDGSIGWELQRVPITWLKAAGKLRKPEGGWFKKIIEIALDNDYGLKDRFLEHVDILLPEKEIRYLVNEFYQLINQHTKIEDEVYDYKLHSLRICIGELAIALKDPDLYKESVLIRSKKLNELQTQDVAEKYIEFGKPEMAIELINEINWEDRFKLDKLNLLAKCYEKLNNKDKLIEIKRTIYDHSPNKNSYNELIRLLPENKKADFQKQVLEDAMKLDNLTNAIQLLFALNRVDLAEKMIIEKADKLDGFYGRLLELVDLFENDNRIIPQVILYRALLLDILDRAYSKAYKYAASYYKKLEQLNNQVEEFPENIENNEDFQMFLEKRHGRKKAFWSKV